MTTSAYIKNLISRSVLSIFLATTILTFSCKKSQLEEELPPVAAFVGSPTTIDEGQSVQFTDQSTNTPTSWIWDFGDGQSSTLSNPSHVYDNEGVYTVTLTVSNDFGQDTETRTNYITVIGNNFELEYISGNNQTYYGGGMPYPMVFKIQNISTYEYVSGDMSMHGLSLTANASLGYQDGEFDDLNNYCGNGDEGCYGGYYSVPSLGTDPPYTLIITVELRVNGELLDSYELHQNIITNPNTTVTDIDGNVYSTVQIGNQTWMAENIKVTRYADGTSIAYVPDAVNWEALGDYDKAYCWYDNSTTNRDIYGGLYTWAAAMNGAASSDANPSGVQGVCPAGWHIPSDSEWKQLEIYLGMSQAVADSEHYRGVDEGGKLKERGTSHWYYPNTGATNSSGFTALPGGSRNTPGTYVNMGYSAIFPSSTEYDIYRIWVRALSNERSDIYRHYVYPKHAGYSVRCVKD